MTESTEKTFLSFAEIRGDPPARGRPVPAVPPDDRARGGGDPDLILGQRGQPAARQGDLRQGPLPARPNAHRSRSQSRLTSDVREIDEVITHVAQDSLANIVILAADVMFVLDHGRLAERGTHAELAS
jgi:hypothetical protein